ncbi:hypothetical protein TW81_15740 [Vibrio galatheae]|uniref:Methyl-accepting transducer domain-containing protein n=1 Tax=Vibrio galatheae TaxID=579748 RepID=A0A0F4NFB5_9VIBR|nr:methyl-accepting chemotaxis protein [Vibrio galatheae]KJY81805.1 hypothetical protein TW81_15740 [Vibrio galatheae]
MERGFAVVADEVRSLAIRTQESTRMIQESIGLLSTIAQNSVQVMNEGMAKGEETTKLTGLANESLQEVSSEITHLTELNQQTVAAIRMQEGVTSDVTSNITTLKELCVTAENDIVESNRLIDELLAKQVELGDKVSQFKVS